jgi:hypothetical protein
MPSRQATKKAAGIATLNHITYGSMLALKASADASSSVTRPPGYRAPGFRVESAGTRPDGQRDRTASFSDQS